MEIKETGHHVSVDVVLAELSHNLFGKFVLLLPSDH